MGRWSRRVRSRERVTGVGIRVEQLEDRANPAPVGTLDPSFGTTGTVTTTFAGVSQAAAVALQRDGNIVVAGTADATGVSDFALARYLPNGTPDLGFDNTGQLTFGFGGTDVATAVAIQADGKIVEAGYTNVGGAGGNPNNFALTRVNADGSVDTTFNGNGIKTIDFGADDRATGVVVQPDGKIVVVGFTSLPGGADFAVARLNADGSLDTTFNTTGMEAINFGGIDDANAVVLQPDGKIVVVGFTAPAGAPTPGVHTNIAVARLTTTGALDTSFNTTGTETVDLGLDARANAVALQPDGKLVLAGTTGTGSVTNFLIARLRSGGGLDTSFNTTGSELVGFGATTAGAATGVAVQPDGNIVAVGTANPGGAAGATGVVVRVLSTGGLDGSFNGTGEATYGTGTQATTGGVALTPDGRIVVAGGAQVGAAGTASFVTSRLIGTVEKGRDLAVGGSLNGVAAVYATAPGSSGYTTPAAATTFPFGVLLGVNVRTAVADVNGDGVQDTILVTGPGVPIRVAVVSGVDNKTVLVAPFDPFGGGFTGGGFVAAGDFTNSGRAEIVITPDQGGGPRVAVFEMLPTGFFTVANFLGIADPNFRGGARTAVGDLNGDGIPDLVVAAGFGGGPRIAVYDGKTVLSGSPTKLVNDFFVFEPALRNGTYVAVGDVNGDGFADLIVGAGPGGAPRVLILSGAQLTAGGSAAALASPLSNFFVAGNTADRGGVRVAAKDVDGDNKADVVVGSGGGQPSRVRVYPGAVFTGIGEPTTFQDIDPYGAVLADGVYVG
ncbi:MAG: hypothetical protein JWO38_3828 [Gemmataceae bacterium]|nr:hypothetical protein [Gemmataceae bacterium]